MAQAYEPPPLSNTELEHLATRVRLEGERETAAALGIPRHTLARVLARLSVRPGTVLMLRAGLQHVGQAGPIGPEAV